MVLRINNLSIDFITDAGIIPAVRNISMEVRRGEVLAIVGESGSGKSVTALSVLGLLPSPPAKYSSGEILFSGANEVPVDLLKQTPEVMQSIRGNQIAMIFQEPMTSLNPVLSCGTQVMEVIQLHKKTSRDEAKRKTIELFSKVKLPDPENIFKRYPHQLSGGQKQRVMIAVAMSCNPSLLICDEPTTALDVTVQKTILQLIRDLQQEENMSVIFITHDLGVVAEIADRAIVLYQGQIVEAGNVKDIFSNPQHPYTRGLLLCRPVLHTKGERLPVVSDFIETSEDTTHKVQGARDKVQETRTGGDNEMNVPDNIPLMRIEKLNVWYPAAKTFFGRTIDYNKAVNDVSFDVYKGETLGLVGESGCGKTTLGRALLRLIEPVSGKIIFNGLDLVTCKADQLKELRKDIQIVFQDPYSSLNPRLTIGSAISEALKVHDIIATERQRKEKVMELLEKVNLSTTFFERYPHEFSGGQRQRIVIARALSLNPSFVVFDESVSALDVSVQAQVLNLINDLKNEFGFTVIFISHDLAVIRYISDRILVMNKGEIEEIGLAEEIYNHPEKEYTKRLIAAIPGIEY